VAVEVTWLRWLLADFGVSVSIPTPLLPNSAGAISIAYDPVKHELTKHVGVNGFIHKHMFKSVGHLSRLLQGIITRQHS
jgi:hypothetical protein